MTGDRTVCIVQARVGSSRLPGKVLQQLGNAPVLTQVLRRCRAIPGVDAVVCATVDGSDGDPIADLAVDAGCSVFRGSETDVLARYHGAAHAAGATIVLRVTSDCPLIDPAVCGDVLALRCDAGADYATNNMPPGWPHGLDCEAFTTVALDQALVAAREPGDREHVTPWIRRHDGFRRVNLAGPGGALVHQRWTLDYPEDLDFLRAVVERLGPDETRAGWRDIAGILEQRPDLLAINAMRHQR